MIQVGCSDTSARSFFYVATKDDQASITTMRLNFASVTDITIRGEPAEQPSTPTFVDALAVQRVIDAVRASDRSAGERVDLPA